MKQFLSILFFGQMPSALALSPLGIGKLCWFESTDPTDLGTHPTCPSPLS